jgi:ABC-type branched-subunit amino acid transport system substrate-binding protein
MIRNLRWLAVLLMLVSVALAACATAEAPEAEPVEEEEAAPAEEEAEEEPAPAAEEAAPAEMEPILIGLDMPVSGGAALEGQNIQHGAELAADEINAAGGLLGHPVEFRIGDNQCDSAVGVSALRALIEVDKVHVTMGSTCSSVTLAVMGISEETETASLDVTATNPDISAQSGPAGGNIWKFRLNLNDLLMNEEFANRVIAQEVDSVALMVTNTDYGRGVVDVLKGIIPDLIVTEEYFALGDADFRPLLTRINELDPEARPRGDPHHWRLLRSQQDRHADARARNGPANLWPWLRRHRQHYGIDP